MNKFETQFVTNAGMKDILGRGLINDDSIAILELIKNAKDAGSPHVNIKFNSRLVQSEQSTALPLISEITIIDTGKGMDEHEINTKWLNIAYSEKKGRTEKNYAGNKGVGRFSCDRLGKFLTLYSKAEDGDYIKLPIDWKLFENKGSGDEISNIKLTGEKLKKETFLEEVNLKDFNTGTILKISHLRSDWNSKKLKKLLGELEKFSPSLDSDFEIFIEATKIYDEKQVLPKSNRGKVNNSILDKLTLKTTHISSQIDENGEFIHTSLYFQDEVIYSYKAENPYKHLKNIRVELHYLDTVSKAYFKRKTGVTSVSYGSIFLFYNGFRISPYGNVKNDWLGLDQRKGQGSNRYLGTREVFGRIDITDKHDNFSVITSREGLAQNDALIDLIANDDREYAILKTGKESLGFVTVLFRQLENFVVGGLNWNRLIDKLGLKKIVTLEDVNNDPERYGAKEIEAYHVQEVLEKLLKSNFKVVEHDFNEKVIKAIKNKSAEKFERYKRDFINNTKDKTLAELTPNEKGVVKKLIEEETKQKEAAIEERDYAEEKAKEVTTDLIVQKEKNKYLLESRKHLSPDAESLIHTVKLTNSKIKNITTRLIDDVISETIDKQTLLEKLSKILSNSNIALKMTQMATKADFTNDLDSQNVDMLSFIEEYVKEQIDSFNSELSVEFVNFNRVIMKHIDVLGLSIVLDNLVSNSEKWNAKNIRISAPNSSIVKILFSDDGVGVSDRFVAAPDSLFELGTNESPIVYLEGGSGIGLYHVKQNLKKMRADISFIGNDVELSGATFEMEFK
jgi:signal transduction histidine kinase